MYLCVFIIELVIRESELLAHAEPHLRAIWSHRSNTRDLFEPPLILRKPANNMNYFLLNILNMSRAFEQV
jgi:hypothetical protein